MSIKLQPIKRSAHKKVKLLQEKQNNWVLDCVNEQKTKLQPYSVVKDRFLKYFVVRVPKKQKNYCKTERFQQSPGVDSVQFRDFLSSQRQKLLQNREQNGRREITERHVNESKSFENKNMKNDKIKNSQGQQVKVGLNQQKFEDQLVKKKSWKEI